MYLYYPSFTRKPELLGDNNLQKMFTHMSYADFTGHTHTHTHTKWTIHLFSIVSPNGKRWENSNFGSFSNHLSRGLKQPWRPAIRGKGRNITSSVFIGGGVGRDPGCEELISTEDPQTIESWPLLCSGLQVNCWLVWSWFWFWFVLVAWFFSAALLYIFPPLRSAYLL